MQKNNTLPQSTVVILRKEQHILLHKRHNTGWMDEHYALLGGRIEDNETPVLAAIRELHEEVGIQVEEHHVKLVHVLHLKDCTVFFVEVTQWTGEPRIMEPHKCTELLWCTQDTLPANAVPFLKTLFNRIDNNIEQSNEDW